MYYLDGIINSAGFFLFDWIKWLLGQILNGIFLFLSNFGITNAAVCIIIFTCLVKALMIPLSIKQQKMSKMSSIIQPEIQKIQAKYKGKKDQESVTKMNREVTAVYEKYGTSPTAGCLTSLITLPIMWALYRVVTNLPDYIPYIHDLYEKAANAIVNSGNKEYADILSGFTEGMKNVSYSAKDGTEGAINVLKNLSSDQWTELANKFGDFKSSKEAIITCSDEMNHINKFLGGLNIAEVPTKHKWPGLLIPVFAVITQWYSMAQIQAKTNNKADENNPTAQSMKMMTKIMPFFSGFICLALPIGVGLYWIVSSLFQIGQQFLVGRHMDRIDMEELVAQNKEKAARKEENKKQSKLWGKLLDMKDEAQAQMLAEDKPARSVSDYAKISSKKIEEDSSVNDSDDDNNSEKSAEDNSSIAKGSIASYANILNSKK